MDGPPTSPQDLADGWRFAARAVEGATRIEAHPEGLEPLLLVMDEEGAWWAIPAGCTRCGSPHPVPDPSAPATSILPCATCGAHHGPGASDGAHRPVLQSDEELYVLVGAG